MGTILSAQYATFAINKANKSNQLKPLSVNILIRRSPRQITNPLNHLNTHRHLSTNICRINKHDTHRMLQLFAASELHKYSKLSSSCHHDAVEPGSPILNSTTRAYDVSMLLQKVVTFSDQHVTVR